MVKIGSEIASRLIRNEATKTEVKDRRSLRSSLQNQWARAFSCQGA